MTKQVATLNLANDLTSHKSSAFSVVSGIHQVYRRSQGFYIAIHRWQINNKFSDFFTAYKPVKTVVRGPFLERPGNLPGPLSIF